MSLATFYKGRAIVFVGLLILAGIAFGVWYAFVRVPPSPIAANLWELTLSDYDGTPFDLSDLRKQPFVVTTFASWCPFCAAELRAFAEAGAGSGVTILAVNRAEPKSVAKDYLDHLSGVEGLLFLDDPDDRVYKALEGYAMPETVFIDSAGQAFDQQHGPFSKPALISSRFVDFLAAEER